jgi:hypothetical protein
VRIFIGFDSREAVAYHTCVQSIIETCSAPEQLSFTPVTGERRDGSNAFIYARFLVPYWCGFKGIALFLDGDMIVRSDVLELYAGSHTGVSVVKHDYKTKYPVKYLGNRNEDYPRKNWSSVMVWNCGYFPNRVLYPDFVAQQTGSFLHRFGWLNDDQIGELDPAWNHLVSEYAPRTDSKIDHYTLGIPAFKGWACQERSQNWRETAQRAMSPIEIDLGGCGC